ncbi:MAG TPA: recombinase family protein [Acidimicrobiales bacterium]|jgi:DNA invertase Pin-like site-specific DNA recombinase
MTTRGHDPLSLPHCQAIVCLDIGVDTSTAQSQPMANVFAASAEFERKLIAERTKASHQVRRQRGQRAGQKPLLPDILRYRIAAEVAEGRSLRAIADQLNADLVPTAKGGRWYASTVRHVARSVDLERTLAIAAATQSATDAPEPAAAAEEAAA